MERNSIDDMFSQMLGELDDLTQVGLSYFFYDTSLYIHPSYSKLFWQMLFLKKSFHIFWVVEK